jgi:multiple antibiotic resistance protein
MLQIALTAFATYDVLRLFGISLPALRGGGGILMLLLVLARTLGLLLLAHWLERAIGTSTLSVVSRIAGILLAAVAAEMILQGIGESGALRAAGR